MNEVNKTAKLCADTLKGGNKLIFCGNGGSAELSNHLAAEFVCKLEKPRRALEALSLCANIALVTAIANDFGYKYIFSRQLEACAKEGDILFCISTSGKSENVLEACTVAKKIGVLTIALTNGEDNPLKNLADITISHNGTTAKVQEQQLVFSHLLVEKTEKAML